MTEQINDQISAFIDDELSAEESALLVRRFERDTAAHGQAMRYTVIGSALRGELLDPYPDVLRHRIAAALTGAAAPAGVAVGPPPTRVAARFWKPAAGFGIAATVAVAALFGLRSLNDDSALAPRTAAAPIVQEQPILASELLEAPSYVVPQEVDEARAVMPPIRLTNYLMHHGEYASRLSRTSVNSNVVGAAEPPLPAPPPVEASTDAVLE